MGPTQVVRFASPTPSPTPRPRPAGRSGLLQETAHPSFSALRSPAAALSLAWSKQVRHRAGGWKRAWDGRSAMRRDRDATFRVRRVARKRVTRRAARRWSTADTTQAAPVPPSLPPCELYTQQPARNHAMHDAAQPRLSPVRMTSCVRASAPPRCGGCHCHPRATLTVACTHAPRRRGLFAEIVAHPDPSSTQTGTQTAACSLRLLPGAGGGGGRVRAWGADALRACHRQ